MQAGGYVLSGANAAYTTTELAHQLGDSGAEVVFVHPSILEVALSATSSLGWSRKRQRQFIILAVESDETGPAGDCWYPPPCVSMRRPDCDIDSVQVV
jgi:hypothetical protein